MSEIKATSTTASSSHGPGSALSSGPDSKSTAETAILLVSCGDKQGLVAALAQLLAGHGANILTADQHSDERAGEFFQRIRFDLTRLVTDRGTLERALAEVADRFGMKVELFYENRRPRMGIFVSQYDHCLQDLLWRQRNGELECDIPLIISNRPDLQKIADQMEIPFHLYPINKQNKPAQEKLEIELLREHKIDLVILARYMQILTGDFISHFKNKIINIHHSFLPAFAGGKPYHQAAERGVKLIGATAHYATADLDEGPIIEQDVIRATHKDSISDLVRKGRDVERGVLGRAVRWHLQHRILVHGNRTVIFE